MSTESIGILLVVVVAAAFVWFLSWHANTPDQSAPPPSAPTERGHELGDATASTPATESDISSVPQQIVERIVYRDSPARPAQVIERIVYRDPEPQRYEGPPQWVFNIDYTQFVKTMAKVLRGMLPEETYDRQRLAEVAEVSPSTLEKLIEGNNPQLLTLWKVCSARRIPLSRVFFEVERSLAEGRRLRP